MSCLQLGFLFMIPLYRFYQLNIYEWCLTLTTHGVILLHMSYIQQQFIVRLELPIIITLLL